MSSRNKELVRYIFEEIFNQKKAGLVASLYALDFRGNSPDGPIEGRNGFYSFFEKYAAAFPDFVLHFDHMIGDGEWVAVPYTFIGTNGGALDGVPATGCVVEIQGMVITRILDNRVIEQSFVWDNLEPRRQVQQAVVASHRLSQLGGLRTSTRVFTSE